MTSIDPNNLSCPLPIGRHATVQIGHGSGGVMSNSLIHDMFLQAFDNPLLAKMDDFAALEWPAGGLAISTDSFVVDPIFFPGGDIGDLAVNGTVNDVAMSGARPRYLSVGFILEEGFALEDLRRVVSSMARAAQKAGVSIVTGDTKVVHKGKGDKIFINTTGIGAMHRPVGPAADRLAAGDRIVLSGPIADHGMCILSQREGLAFELPIESDTAALNGLIETILDEAGADVHALRDPTRGGVAAVLNEYARTSGAAIRIHETLLPVRPAVAGACEILGFDPLLVANEGKLVAVVAPQRCDDVLRVMRGHEHGREAVVIGEVLQGPAGRVEMVTAIGGRRIVDMPVGEQLPRIC